MNLFPYLSTVLILLILQNMNPSLNNVLETVIKIVNYVKTRFFQKLCEEIKAEHTALSTILL